MQSRKVVGYLVLIVLTGLLCWGWVVRDGNKTEIEADIGTLQSDTAQNSKQIEELKTEVEDLKSKNSDLDTEVEDLKSKNSDLDTELEDLKSKNSDLDTRLGRLETRYILPGR